MFFRDMLGMVGVAATDVAVILHKPPEKSLRRMLPAIAEDRPDLFDAYQNNHGKQVEATLKARKYLASFVSLGGSDMAFVALYAIEGWDSRSADYQDTEPQNMALRELYGLRTFAEVGAESGQAIWDVFRLTPLDTLADLRGRLILLHASTPNYVRLAENLLSPVAEVRRTGSLAPPVPDWKSFVVTTQELLRLPQSWATALAGWRGVYLIVDEADGGARYVGSAYGQDNLFGRWRAHTHAEFGVTVELGKRNTSQFRFSILQILLHDATADTVTPVESNWKLRLHTKEFRLNRN